MLKSGLLLCLATFAACSSDDDAPERTAPTFPEKQTLSIEAGETLQVRFEAAQPWRMTADKTWVRFLAGDPAEEMPVVSGGAGANTVTLFMKADGHTFREEVARIDMTMDNASQTVFEVKRPARERAIRMMVSREAGGEFAETGELELLFGKSCNVGFEANFDWKIRSTPDWLAPLTRITGEADEPATHSSSNSIITRNAVAQEKLPFEQRGEIVVAPHKGDGPEFRFPVVYPGVDDRLVQMLSTDPVGRTYYFDHDGFYGSKNPSNNGIEFTGEKEATLSVLTRELQRSIRIVRYDKQTGAAVEVSPEESWLVCRETPGSPEITLSAKSFEEKDDRALYVYFLPPYYAENDYDFSKDFSLNWQNEVVFAPADIDYGRAVVQVGKPRIEGFEIKAYDKRWNLVVFSDPVKVADRPDLVERYGTANIYARAFTADEWTNDFTQNYTVTVFGFDGYTQSNPAQKSEQEKWFRNFQPGQGQFSIGQRVAFDKLPDGEYPIEVLRSDGSVYGVLIISKAE